MKQRSNQWILIIILVISVVLRMFNFSEIPFTHDEFSALDRLNFDSFSALINEGVKIDGHPAGVQVFLYYWTKLFGFSEQALKFPFIVFGVLSVYFTYLIGKRWFNETVGLLSAATVSCLQFTVMFSQIARPYISGLLFSLMMVYYLTKLIQKPEKNFYLNGVLFVITGALCAYNHHFSLLFAAIVGISGAFFIKRQYLLKYLLFGIAIFVLYIPHLSIFFYQLNLGGIEQWLAKPEPDFILRFCSYVFNHSWFLISTISLIFLGSLFSKNANHFNIKRYVLFLTWFLLPIVIGYFYSTYFSAVLHYSVLIFSFTFLVYLLFGNLPNCKPKYNALWVGIILLVGTFSLVFERQHYQYFYQSIYVKVLEDQQKVLKKEEEKDVLSIIHSVGHINNYYLQKFELDSNYLWYNDFEGVHELRAFLEEESSKYDRLYLGSLHNFDPIAIPIIKSYFPYLEKQENYFGGSTYLFSKTQDEDPQNDQHVVSIGFEEKAQEYADFDSRFVIDSSFKSGEKAYRMLKKEEWGPGLSIPIQKLNIDENYWVDVEVSLKSEDLTASVLVMEVKEENNNLLWSGFNTNEEVKNIEVDNKWITYHGTLKMDKSVIHNKEAMLKVYIWNKEGRSFLLDDLKLSVRKGNPIVYGIVNPI